MKVPDCEYGWRLRECISRDDSAEGRIMSAYYEY